MEAPSRVMRCAYVEEPVQDGVAEGGVTDEVVPVLDGELAGEDGATRSESLWVVADHRLCLYLFNQGSGASGR